MRRCGVSLPVVLGSTFPASLGPTWVASKEARRGGRLLLRAGLDARLAAGEAGPNSGGNGGKVGPELAGENTPRPTSRGGRAGCEGVGYGLASGLNGDTSVADRAVSQGHR